MQTNMNDLVELMSIIGSLENQRRKDIDQGFTDYWKGFKLKLSTDFRGWFSTKRPDKEIIERMYYYMHW